MLRDAREFPERSPIEVCITLGSRGSLLVTRREQHRHPDRATRVVDSWSTVHEHTSVPFYMDGTLRPASDLQP